MLDCSAVYIKVLCLKRNLSTQMAPSSQSGSYPQGNLWKEPSTILLSC